MNLGKNKAIDKPAISLVPRAPGYQTYSTNSQDGIYFSSLRSCPTTHIFDGHFESSGVDFESAPFRVGGY